HHARFAFGNSLGCYYSGSSFVLEVSYDLSSFTGGGTGGCIAEWLRIDQLRRHELRSHAARQELHHRRHELADRPDAGRHAAGDDVQQQLAVRYRCAASMLDGLLGRMRDVALRAAPRVLGVPAGESAHGEARA